MIADVTIAATNKLDATEAVEGNNIGGARHNMTHSPIQAAPALSVGGQDGGDDAANNGKKMKEGEVEGEAKLDQHLMQVREMAGSERAAGDDDYSDDQDKAEE